MSVIYARKLMGAVVWRLSNVKIDRHGISVRWDFIRGTGGRLGYAMGCVKDDDSRLPHGLRMEQGR